MYTNYQKPIFERDNKQTKPRDKIPAYAHSRGVELQFNKSIYPNVPNTYNVRRHNLQVHYPVVPDFELPNEEQIYYYEQLMMMSNEKIVLNRFLENKGNYQFHTEIQNKNYEYCQNQFVKHNMQRKPTQFETLPFYKICFDLIQIPTRNLQWKLSLISKLSTDLRSEICQTYINLWLHYKSFMQSEDLGTLKMCSKMISHGRPISETELFYLTIRDDYCMATQILILLKNVLPQEHNSFMNLLKTLELWKDQVQKISNVLNAYDLTVQNNSIENTDLLDLLTKSYTKIKHYIAIYFDLLMDKKSREHHMKDDLLCCQWYLMIGGNNY
ncbi:uncharacterized protein LOC126895431 [Daktulosphaira vitifoliae]|uniref:uncharacterized protein LOC126895431 n=1 Tax=Daktulosphaira vitifoliae TaxID=58002 RepID=UPI0021AA514B|nr:uncharacterized protein LOC126895431 [Daktulosphaira vitifoliae]XP_050523235.1 uncharacterized protein LOC126895431 [Daktulosphaira vitifoliae]